MLRKKLHNRLKTIELKFDRKYSLDGAIFRNGVITRSENNNSLYLQLHRELSEELQLHNLFGEFGNTIRFPDIDLILK